MAAMTSESPKRARGPLAWRKSSQQPMTNSSPAQSHSRLSASSDAEASESGQAGGCGMCYGATTVTNVEPSMPVVTPRTKMSVEPTASAVANPVSESI